MAILGIQIQSSIKPPSLPPSQNGISLHHHFHNRFFLSKRRIGHSNSSRIQSKNGSNNIPPLPETDCPVPSEQQPVNEYQNLSTSFPFSWACGDLVSYCSRLLVTGVSFTLVIALPVAWFGAVGSDSDPWVKIIGAVSSGVLFVTLAVLRMYLGWAYVGNRLLSATVEYEETGWYDGQIWVKTAQVLARDRLLGSFQVKPLLSRLKYTLVSLGASLVVCVVLLINVEAAKSQSPSSSYPTTTPREGRAIPGVYNDESARSFEPDSFCGGESTVS